MKTAYEKPTIVRQVGGITNKFGLGMGKRFQDQIDGVPVADLMERFGSPLFVYSERTLKRTYQSLMDAFSMRYPKVRHAWSYKTNYLKAICKSFHELGSWAEVVSLMEYEMARRLGVPGHQIIFNGPHKPRQALHIAAREGAIINIDGLDELEHLEAIAVELGRPVKIGLRFNMSLGAQMSWDRYGFNIDSGAAMDALRRTLASGRITVSGFHAHIGTFVYDADHYGTAVRKLIEFHKAAEQELGIQLDYLDLGGGFASKNRLKGSYLSTMDMVSSFDQYAEAICEPLLEAYPTSKRPQLILESGRAMIDDAGILLSSVVAAKRLNNGKRGIVIDAGVNLLFTSFWYDHEVVPTIDRGMGTEEHTIYGPLCMQIDVIRDQIRLPHLECGDAIMIRPVGAYNNTQWMQFIELRPNVVMIGQSGDISLIRQAETVDYLQQGESIPEWLRD